MLQAKIFKIIHQSKNCSIIMHFFVALYINPVQLMSKSIDMHISVKILIETFQHTYQMNNICDLM